MYSQTRKKSQKDNSFQPVNYQSKKNSKIQILTGRLENLLRVNGDGVSFIGNDRLEFVVDNLSSIEFDTFRLDQISNGGSFSEARDILTNLVEGDNEVVTSETTKLGLGLITQNNQIRFRLFVDQTAGGLGDTDVNTTAQTTVRRCGNEKGLAFFSSLGFSVFVEG